MDYFGVDVGVLLSEVLLHPHQLFPVPADDADVESEMGEFLAVAKSNSIGSSGDDSPTSLIFGEKMMGGFKEWSE